MRKLFFAFLMIGMTIVSCTTDPYGTPPEITDPTDENACADGVISFQHEILPLVTSSCAKSGCHDPIRHKEGLILNSYTGIMEIVRAGKSNKSKLFTSLSDFGEDLMPPPPDKLTSDQIDIIGRWIDQGAKETMCNTGCDPTSFTFEKAIFPLMKTYCIGCHNDNLASGDINLKDYAAIKDIVEKGRLLGTARHDTGFSPMPPGQKLSDCNITQIEKWINDGAKNN